MDVHNDWKRFLIGLLQAVTLYFASEGNSRITGLERIMSRLEARQDAVETIINATLATRQNAAQQNPKQPKEVK